jgi:hypothetical protein
MRLGSGGSGRGDPRIGIANSRWTGGKRYVQQEQFKQLIQEAAKRQGCSASQLVREAALMRAAMAADDNPYPMRALAAQLRAIGDQGSALAEKALRVADNEGERQR